MRTGRRHAGPRGLAALAAIAASLAGALVPAGSSPAAVADLRRPVVERWMSLQRADGSFRDHVLLRRRLPGTDRYGPAMLGYAFVQHGVDTGDRRVAVAGLRAIRYALTHRSPSPREVFEDLALAATYNLARDAYAREPAFVRLRKRWEARLRGVRARVLRSSRPYFNHHLVQSLAILELLRTDLRSTARGSILAGRRAARAAVLDVVGRRLPAAAARTATPSRAGALALVSDPPSHPLAYHGFSTALLGRILALLGDDAPARGRAVQQRAARTSWALMSPHGDLTYSGRSQEQSWTLAMTAAGSAVAGAVPGTPAIEAARGRAVAERALDRLARAYAGGPFGMWIAPALRGGVTAGVRGLDPYAAAGSYTALTLVALGWTEEALGRVPAGTVPLGGDEPGAFHVGRGTSALVAVRSGAVWFAVKQTPAAHTRTGVDYFTDLRYDAGLVALDRRGDDGVWRGVLPLRPRTERTFDAAGPLLRHRGRIARPVGRRLRVAGDGVVRLTAVFRRADGRALAGRSTLRFEPLACGVRIVAPARRSGRWEYSAFFAGRPRRRGTRTVADAGQRVTVFPAARVSTERGYASGEDASLTRVRFAFPARRRPVTITICEPGR
jgi:hypothetical protein